MTRAEKRREWKEKFKQITKDLYKINPLLKRSYRRKLAKELAKIDLSKKEIIKVAKGELNV